jgi:hypothetical protein
MNHSNKDTRSSAESGEGRPLIKENAGQSNTYPTQSGKGVSQGLAGVRKAARDHKDPDKRPLRGVLDSSPHHRRDYADGKQLAKEGRHVGLDFYDLLIESDYTS